MRQIEATTIAIMLICGALALIGCTGAAVIGTFIGAACVRAGIEVRDFVNYINGR